MSAKKKWNDLSDTQRAGLLVLISLQLSLAATAWTDLASRPAAKVQGSKGKWAAIIAINFIGPVLYFLRGRRD